MRATLDDWFRHEAVPFSPASPDACGAATDKVIAALGESVELLGFGEALHGGEEILALRNRLFQRLVERHGYCAIALESSFPRGRAVEDYISGSGPAPALYEEVRDTGFSHNFGRLDANRDLVEWMRKYNADPRHPVKLRFYGFDSPTEMVGTDSPRQLLHFALDYLASLDPAGGQVRRARVDALLGADSAWENPAASFDPAQSIGLSPAAAALRVETEDLITELHIRRPELVAKGGADLFSEAAHHAHAARLLLGYHAALARASSRRLAELLGIRDLMMAENLAYIVSRERGRGKVLAFAHNSHLKRGQAQWQLGAELLAWWPAGAHLAATLGTRYAVIGSAVGVSDANGIAAPEAGTLEARLTAAGPEPAVFIPTHGGRGLPAAEIAALPIRAGSRKNPTYFPLTPQSFTEFDWLAVLRAVTYSRGGPPLREPDDSTSAAG